MLSCFTFTQFLKHKVNWETDYSGVTSERNVDYQVNNRNNLEISITWELPNRPYQMSVFCVQEAELKHREGLYLSLMSYDSQPEEFKIRGKNPVFQFTILLPLDHILSVFCKHTTLSQWAFHHELSHFWKHSSFLQSLCMYCPVT